MVTPIRVVVRLVAVFAVVAAALRVADSVPRAVTGLPRGVTTLDTLDEVETRSGAAFPMPSYFPRHLRWPPSDVTIDGTGTASVSLRHRETGERWLTITSAPAATSGVRMPSLPAASVLQESEAAVGDWTARVLRLQDREGAIWHEAAWRTGNRLLSVRYRGPLDELIRIAASLRSGSSS